MSTISVTSRLKRWIERGCCGDLTELTAWVRVRAYGLQLSCFERLEEMSTTPTRAPPVLNVVVREDIGTGASTAVIQTPGFPSPLPQASAASTLEHGNRSTRHFAFRGKPLMSPSWSDTAANATRRLDDDLTEAAASPLALVGADDAQRGRQALSATRMAGSASAVQTTFSPERPHFRVRPAPCVPAAPPSSPLAESPLSPSNSSGLSTTKPLVPPTVISARAPLPSVLSQRQPLFFESRSWESVDTMLTSWPVTCVAQLVDDDPEAVSCGCFRFVVGYESGAVAMLRCHPLATSRSLTECQRWTLHAAPIRGLALLRDAKAPVSHREPSLLVWSAGEDGLIRCVACDSGGSQIARHLLHGRATCMTATAQMVCVGTSAGQCSIFSAQSNEALVSIDRLFPGAVIDVAVIGGQDGWFVAADAHTVICSTVADPEKAYRIFHSRFASLSRVLVAAGYILLLDHLGSGMLCAFSIVTAPPTPSRAVAASAIRHDNQEDVEASAVSLTARTVSSPGIVDTFAVAPNVPPATAAPHVLGQRASLVANQPAAIASAQLVSNVLLVTQADLTMSVFSWALSSVVQDPLSTMQLQEAPQLSWKPLTTLRLRLGGNAAKFFRGAHMLHDRFLLTLSDMEIHLYHCGGQSLKPAVNKTLFAGSSVLDGDDRFVSSAYGTVWSTGTGTVLSV